jgi:histidinol-phosphate aminotransferase
MTIAPSTPARPAGGPVSRIDPEAAYRRPTAPGPALLRLDSNEGVLPPQQLLAQLAGADPELLRRYPEVSALEAALAARLGVAPERVIVTAGADEAIDRACRAFLEPDRTLLLPDPCFDMFDRCAALAGGTPVRVAWRDGPFPLDGFLERLDARTAVVVVVTPNNPTGAVATLAQVRRLAAAAPNALLVIDHVYVEYADADLTPGVLDLPNVLVLRTFSKAWGLAGCRVGYSVGSPYVIGVLRAAGGPYSVAAPSIALALAQLERGEGALRAHVARIRTERDQLAARLAGAGAGGGLAPQPSQANFVLVECGARAQPIRAALAERGVVVRDFPGRPGLETSLRITLPGNPADFERLCAALDAALAPGGPRS